MKKFFRGYFIALHLSSSWIVPAMISTTGLLVFVLCLAAINPVSGTSRHLRVEIKVEKTEYKIGEPIEGKIIISSDLPATYLNTFTIRVYHNDEQVDLRFTKAPVFTGSTEFELKNFGIPVINTGPQAVGLWRIEIEQGSSDYAEDSVSAEFHIRGSMRR